MVLEAVLYFVLGFLCAGLLALMVSPAIWNRAVILTKRKIESSVPLTLNEVQADKDQLRAEFAMSTRRLEMNIEELKERASAQLIDINRKRDELTSIISDRKEKLQEIQELESRTSELRANLAEREAKIEELSFVVVYEYLLTIVQGPITVVAGKERRLTFIEVKKKKKDGVNIKL